MLSGAVDFARGKEALDAALAQLARPDRILLVTPPFDEHSSPYPGRSAEYPPGVRENGGQYSHGVSWLVDALTRLAVDAAARGDSDGGASACSRAPSNSWVAISPLSKLATPAQADIYGLPPHQQPADVYEGPGYEGRGGWAWYSGAAARMLSAAYALLGIEMVDGALRLRADAFEAKGDLRLESVTFRGRDIHLVRRSPRPAACGRPTLAIVLSSYISAAFFMASFHAWVGGPLLLVVALSFVVWATAGRAGAFLQPPGEGVAILSTSFAEAHKAYDSLGRLVSAPAYDKLETQLYVEYGLHRGCDARRRDELSALSRLRPNTYERLALLTEAGARRRGALSAARRRRGRAL